MGRALKYLAFLLGGIVVLLVVAAISFLLLFDPNDFRDRIAAETKEATGRDLVIEGDLAVNLFPWLAIEVGLTRLGNAPGFGDEPFATFENAKLSVRLLPMLLRREISVGTAELDTLVLNLAVAANGTTNWDDLVQAGEAAPEEEAAGGGAVFDVAGIAVRNTTITYRDAQTGETLKLTDVNMRSGRVAGGDPVPLSGELAFVLEPGELRGTLELDTVVMFDTDAETIAFDDLEVEGVIEGFADVPASVRFEAPAVVVDTGREVITPGAIEASVLGIDLTASIEPFSYAGDLEYVATIRLDPFSPKSLMQRLNMEVPPTADPGALERLSLAAKAAVGTRTIALTDVTMRLDDTTFKGSATLPREETGRIRFDFSADSINLDRYMAPATEGGAGGDEVPVEIPVDLIRALNVSGSLKVAEGFMSGLRFTNVNLGLESANGRLRVHPVTADLYEGRYSGDVRIDASGQAPALSVNEQITGVKIGSLVAAMFDQKNVTGTVNGAFVLAGRGADLAAIQRDLDGNISLELLDGAYEGVDVWYELRKARALLKQQPAPAVSSPARTRFSNVRVAGPVADGIFTNPDFLAELPFMRLTGQGTVDIPAATLDYRLSARVLDKPELAQQGSAEEVADFTKVVIPLRITGALASPRLVPDVEGLVRERVRQEVEQKKEELKGRIIDEIIGGRDRRRQQPAEQTTQQPAPQAPAEGAAAPAAGEAAEAPAEQAPADEEAPAEEEKSVEDQLKETLLKKIFE